MKNKKLILILIAAGAITSTNTFAFGSVVFQKTSQINSGFDNTKFQTKKYKQEGMKEIKVKSFRDKIEKNGEGFRDKIKTKSSNGWGGFAVSGRLSTTINKNNKYLNEIKEEINDLYKKYKQTNSEKEKEKIINKIRGLKSKFYNYMKENNIKKIHNKFDKGIKRLKKEFKSTKSFYDKKRLNKGIEKIKKERQNFIKQSDNIKQTFKDEKSIKNYKVKFNTGFNNTFRNKLSLININEKIKNRIEETSEKVKKFVSEKTKNKIKNTINKKYSKKIVKFNEKQIINKLNKISKIEDKFIDIKMNEKKKKMIMNVLEGIKEVLIERLNQIQNNINETELLDNLLK